MKKIYFSISNHQILRNQSQKYKKAQISSRMRGRCTSRKWKMGWKYFITKNNVENLICREEENNVREKGTVSSKYLQKRKKGVGEWLGSSSLSQSERTQQEGARAGPALSAPTSQRHNLPTATGGMCSTTPPQEGVHLSDYHTPHPHPQETTRFNSLWLPPLMHKSTQGSPQSSLAVLMSVIWMNETKLKDKYKCPLNLKDTYTFTADSFTYI